MGGGLVGGLLRAISRFLGLRRIGGPLLRRTPVGEHQQQVTAAVERRGGHGADNGERLGLVWIGAGEASAADESKLFDLPEYSYNFV